MDRLGTLDAEFLHLGITGDYDTAPDVQILASATSTAIEQLRDRALDVRGG